MLGAASKRRKFLVGERGISRDQSDDCGFLPILCVGSSEHPSGPDTALTHMSVFRYRLLPPPAAADLKLPPAHAVCAVRVPIDFKDSKTKQTQIDVDKEN